MEFIPLLSFTDESIYQYISKDKDIFRVYCTSNCFNPQLLSKYHIQIFNGETPIQDAKFVKFLESAGNYHHAQFAVIFPPYQVWQIEKPPIPNSTLLGEANVKYIASNYPINSDDYTPIQKFQNIFLYQNKNFKSRAYFIGSNENVKIRMYTPNNITFEFAKASGPRNLILAENYYPGWYAFIDHQKFKVQRFDPIFRKITVPPSTDKVELKYQPESFMQGKTITFATIAVLIMIVYRISPKRRNGQYRNS